MKNRNQEKKLENIDFKEYFISLLKKSEIKVENEKIGIFKDSLDFLNIMGSYAEAQYYVNEYVDTKFPIFRKKRIFW